MHLGAKRQRVLSPRGMEPLPRNISALPVALSTGRCFRSLSTLEASVPVAGVAQARTISTLTGRRLGSRRAAELQAESSSLPAARANTRICSSVVANPITIIDGTTGSGKSTQVPQQLLEMQKRGELAKGAILHVMPLIEGLVALHGRLEDEMEAEGWIHLATGREVMWVDEHALGLYTCGVLVQAWWDVIGTAAALIFDEAHIRSVAYTELFELVLPQVRQQRLKLIVMSATMQAGHLESFFGDENCNKLVLDGRRHPLHRFEIAEPIDFGEQELVDALVEVATSEAELDIGALIVFVRGERPVEAVAARIALKTKAGESLEGWLVLPWYGRADEEVRHDVGRLSQANMRCIIVATEGLGASLTLPCHRTTISSCVVNGLVGKILAPMANSKGAVLQEGGRVARVAAGRHILLRQLDRLPEAHEAEIRNSSLHKVVLRIIRDHGWGDNVNLEWPAGEEPPKEDLDNAYQVLGTHGCF